MWRYFYIVWLLSHVWLLATQWSVSMPGFLHHLSELAQTHVPWVGDSIQPSHPVIPFSSCLQFFPSSGSCPVCWLFVSGGQSIGASASISVFPMSIEDWFPLRLTGLISSQSKGLSSVFSNTTVQRHQFFSISFRYGLTLTSNITTGKTIALTI